MFISIQQLEHGPVRFDSSWKPGELELDSKIIQSTDLHAAGTARLISRSLGDIRVEGKLDVVVSAACDRCLESAPVNLQRPFDLVYVPSDAAPESAEDEVDEDAIEVGYYTGSGIELNDVLREVVLLALPMHWVCSEDCKGICPVCGQNRNQRECDCHTEAVDDRWSKLKDLTSDFKKDLKSAIS